MEIKLAIQLLDLRPLCEIAAGEKNNLPISLSLKSDGSQQVVSRFGDDIWDFFAYIPQVNIKPGSKIIKWAVALPDGKFLTSPEHSLLLESSKDFIWSLFAQPLEGRKRPSMATLIARFELLVPLLRWMVANGIKAFRDLDGRCLEYVPVAAYSAALAKSVSPSTLHYRLAILESLYFQRTKIHDAIPNHPWPHETALALSGVKRSFAYRVPSTQIIPEEVLRKLAQKAIEYIVDRSPRILSALNDTHAAGLAKREQRRQIQVDARTAAARSAGYNGMLHLKKEGLALRTACYIVIDMFSGLRDSEMMSLEFDCVSRTLSEDRTVDIYWLHGEIFKTGYRKKKWLVPSIVEHAVQVAGLLSSTLRKKLQSELSAFELQATSATTTISKRLHSLRTQQNKLFLSTATKFGNDVSVLSGQELNLNLKEFCSDNSIHGHDGQPYLLHSHQFRRTYAHYIAKAELGDLLTLRDHFGHWSLDMTAYYAHGAFDNLESDRELLEMVASEKALRQEEIVTGWLTTEKPFANGSTWLDDWRSKVRSAKDKNELIRRYAGTITLNGTGHSWCVGNAKGMNCGGLCVFQAQSCVDCKYGVIGPEHRAVWTGIRDQQAEVLALNDVGPGGKARAIEIHEYAEKVLRRLDGKKENLT